MHNYIGTLLSLLVMILIPVGFAQVHVVEQVKQELREIQADAVKKIEAEGNLLPSNTKPLLQAFIASEFETKKFRLDMNKLKLQVSRTDGISDNALTYNDEFMCTITYEKLNLVAFFQSNRNFVHTMFGTMEPLPYDASP
ncbi:hypothetical protein [Brevibacillus reuszeri]|uniref:hypothetical protein n=1 Tax=Brevibacillus reuszeri TaxID=54915 RepID=UPI003D19F828